MKLVIVTTSWDDGHKLDVRLAQLLQQYGLAGTFYIAPQNQELAPSDRLTAQQVKTLSRSFEIGAHTMTHPRLPKIPDDSAYREVLDSKLRLEAMTGKQVTSFCYPGGNYQPKHVAMVRRAGLRYARTVRRHSFDLKASLFEAATTIHAYNHYQDAWRILRFAQFNPRRAWRYRQWDNLAKAMFDRVLAEGGVYHLWGHSWEIDAHNDWQKLQDVFQYIARRPHVQYVSNGGLVEFRPKRLLLAAPYFPPHLGGQENYAFHIAQGLQRDDGWEVRVATSGERGWKLAQTSYKGLVVYRLPYLLKLSNTPLHPLTGWWLRRIIKREDIYTVNAHAPVPLFADIAAWVAGRLPVVVTYHMLSMKKGQVPADWLIRPYERYVLPRTLEKAESIICASDSVRDDFLKSYLGKSRTITPGVDSDFFKPAARRTPQSILFVGSLNKSDTHKGLRYLLEAFRHVSQGHPDARLTIVGSGSGRPGFETLVQQLGLGKQITFRGGQTGARLQHSFQEAAIFVLPSLNDSFSMVTLEAMAAGLPVIATTVGSLPQLVDEGSTGYLVPPADSRALADKLSYLLAHPAIAERLGAQGRHKATQAFSWHSQAQKTDALLRTGKL